MLAGISSNFDKSLVAQQAELRDEKGGEFEGSSNLELESNIEESRPVSFFSYTSAFASSASFFEVQQVEFKHLIFELKKYPRSLK